MLGVQNTTTSTDYAYNADGLRMSKKVDNISTNQYTTIDAFAWDTNESLPLMVTDGTASYIYGPDGLPLESINKSTVKFFHHDQLGSTTMLTSAKGTVLNTFTYTSYGKLLTGSAVTPLLFAGQYRDVETGLYYLRARYYDPGTAQFVSLDPAVAQTQVPYSYSQNDPVNVSDLSGQDVRIGGLDVHNPFYTPPSQEAQNWDSFWGAVGASAVTLFCAYTWALDFCGLSPSIFSVPGSGGRGSVEASIWEGYGSGYLVPSLPIGNYPTLPYLLRCT